MSGGWWRSGWTVWRKEVLENARDRRTLLSALAMGPLLGPLLFAVMASTIGGEQHRRAEETLQLPVAGADYAPHLVAWLRGQGVVVRDPPADIQTALHDQDVSVVLRITPEYGAQWNAAEPARVDLLYDGSQQFTATTVARVRALLGRYGQGIAAQRLLLRGIAPEVVAPVAVVERDVASLRSRSATLLAMVPYMLILSCFIGGMYLAIDTTAGERERQSLEPLLLTSAPRSAMLFAKLAATATYGALSSLVSTLAFAVVTRRIPYEAFGLDLGFGGHVALAIFLAVLPVVVLAAAAQTLVASYARSFREAQSYLQILTLIPVLPGIWLLVATPKVQAWMWSVPILGQNLLINASLRGDAVQAWQWMLASFGTLLLAGLLAVLTWRLFIRERFILAL